MKKPYIPDGVTDQGRMVPTRLRQRAMNVDPRLLLATGAMEAPRDPSRVRQLVRRIARWLGFGRAGF